MNDTRPENFETIYEFLEEEEASVMTEGFQRPPPAAQHNNKHNSRSSSRLNKVLRWPQNVHPQEGGRLLLNPLGLDLLEKPRNEILFRPTFQAKA
ncbi:hypothetical protein CGCFRS4_v004880 [Colletotrichum fructicola]|nr:hypothetical protein CFRS1_v012644 [Colletotrichum fructicola]KAF4897659.1 hypothetical protein CGCFRS4_v004880 [Colletotrichum fructicola]